MDLLTPPSTSDFGREVGQPGPRCGLGAIGPIVSCVILVLCDSREAFLEARKRSGGEVAVILDCVPAGLDAAHV